MKNLSEYIRLLNETVLWGWPTLILLFGTGILLTVRLKGIPLLHGHTLVKAIRKKSEEKTHEKRGVTPVQALLTALAGTIGTGTIAGVAGAITLGGPGSVFWMWVASWIGMATKYTEIVIAHHNRKKKQDGSFHGGIMYAAEARFGKRGRILGKWFCVSAAVASFGIGNLVQMQTLTEYLTATVQTFGVPSSTVTDLLPAMCCAATAYVVYAVMNGSAVAVSRITEKLVPWMGLLYLGMAGTVIASHFPSVGRALSDIVRCAFCPKAVLGSAAGIGMRQVIRTGIGRGIFSNEAGLGSSPIAYAASDQASSVEAGFYGIIEVATVSFLFCTATALMLLLPMYGATSYTIPWGSESGITLAVQALSTVMDARLASLLMTSAIGCFALSSVLTWGFYGSECILYGWGEKATRPYRIVFCITLLLGAWNPSQFVWNFADFWNGLMMIPNLIALLLLHKQAIRLTESYFRTVHKSIKRKTVSKNKLNPFREHGIMR